MSKQVCCDKLNQSAQTLLELVVGLSLISVVIAALAITTTSSSRNTQFSKNQAQATKLAQENLEKVRTIKSSNYGVCFNGQNVGSNCSTWEEVWNVNALPGCTTSNPPICTFELRNGCTSASGGAKPVCLVYKASRGIFPAPYTNFTYQIYIENEVAGKQKKVTSKVYWTDSAGEHSSDLVTVFSRI